MAKNRSLEQKKLKIKRRGRFARFSGEQTKYVERTDFGKYQDVRVINPGTPDEDQIPTGRHVVVAVGKISLSKAVMSTGRGPDKERMQEYYQRVHSYDQALPQTLGLTGPMQELLVKYKEVISEVPREMRIRLVDNHTGTLDLFFNITQFFFVDVDYQKKIVRRSIIYPSKKRAIMALTNKMVRWVETISPPKPQFMRIGDGKSSVAPPKG